MKSYLVLIFLYFVTTSTSIAENVNTEKAKELFQYINLNQKGLEEVQSAVKKGNYQEASEALLTYYRKRKDVRHTEVNLDDDRQSVDLSEQEIEKATKGLNHHFFVHKGYGYFDYGKDINWQHWPVKDNEVRWQLHRMYWWIPMGKMYWKTSDEKYAKEWILQYRDWIKDNPHGLSAENDRFAWRQLETSRRIQDQINLFIYFVNSPSFTPAFLVEFLSNYRYHAERISGYYSKQGNHLLFEAQRMLFAGGFFREFKQAAKWRKEGIDILKEEINKQVFDDGYQYELSPNYHIGCINIFLKALYMAQLCNIDSEFPNWYKNLVEKMITANMYASFPDLIYPMFGDAKLTTTAQMQKNYKAWAKVFPHNKNIKYFATSGVEGNAPRQLSKVLNDCGFYSFRNGWDKNATALIMKAGPSGHFHCQPDNGTFALWYKGVNLMPDAGCYVYSGSAEIQKLREAYRQTCVHQTLTLNKQNIELDAQQLHWSSTEKLDIASYENPSYKTLKHRRTVFFVDKTFFVLLDEAIGEAVGNIDLHFQVKEGDARYDMKKLSLTTAYSNDKNLHIQGYSPQTVNMVKEEQKVSYKYRKELPRHGLSFQQKKTTAEPVKYITVLYPFEGKTPPSVKINLYTTTIDIKVDNQTFQLTIPTK